MLSPPTTDTMQANFELYDNFTLTDSLIVNCKINYSMKDGDKGEKQDYVFGDYQSSYYRLNSNTFIKVVCYTVNSGVYPIKYFNDYAKFYHTISKAYHSSWTFRKDESESKF
jgi:hypothetical protein